MTSSDDMHDPNDSTSTRQRQDSTLLHSVLKAMDNLGHGLVLVNNGSIRFANSAFCSMTGYFINELMDIRNISDIFPATTDSGTFEIDKAIRELRSGHYEEYVQSKTGKKIDVDMSVVQNIDGTSQQQYIAIVRDISARKTAERNAHQQTLLFTQLFNNAPSGIAIVTPNDTIQRVNSEFQRMFGWTEEEISGRPINEIIVPRGRETEATTFSEQARSGNPIIEETQRQRKDGTLVDVLLSAYPYNIDGRHAGVFGMYTDITRRTLLEQQLAQLEKMELAGKLAAGLVHDFNNLLCGIQGSVQMATRDLTTLSNDQFSSNQASILKDAVDILDNALMGCARAAGTIKRLKQITRQTGCNTETLNLNGVASDASKLLYPTLSSPSTTYELTCEGTATQTIMGNQDLIFNMISNLIINSRDAMPSGGSISIKVRDIVLDKEVLNKYATIPAGNYVVLSVSDSGQGIADEMKGVLFDPMASTKGKDRGLGLSMVWNAVQAHKGYIIVDSIPDQGTVFSLYFPPSTGRRSSASERVYVSALAHTGKILVIEDEELLQRLMHDVLSSDGHQVEIHGSAAEALRGYVPGTYDLVLTDIILKDGMNGVQLSKEIKRLDPQVPIIYMTGYNDDATLKDCIRQNIGIEVIDKPIDINVLSSLVHEVLSGKYSLKNRDTRT